VSCEGNIQELSAGIQAVREELAERDNELRFTVAVGRQKDEKIDVLMKEINQLKDLKNATSIHLTSLELQVKELEAQVQAANEANKQQEAKLLTTKREAEAASARLVSKLTTAAAARKAADRANASLQSKLGLLAAEAKSLRASGDRSLAELRSLVIESERRSGDHADTSSSCSPAVKGDAAL